MKINNNGFTLVELLFSISLLAILSISFAIIVTNTFSLTDEGAYKILKNSVIAQTNQYIIECENDLINCENDYMWKVVGENMETSFKLNVMKKYSYFSEDMHINPITNKDISDCLIINVIKDKNSIIDVILDDSNCEK